jgi:DNA polymerase-1
LGWPLLVDSKTNDRSIRNFPMQANGAEMLRVAACLTVERGIGVCASVHDALLIEADENQIDEDVRNTREVMAEASAIVLGGFRLRTDVKIFRYPERFSDPRGERMWQLAHDVMTELGLEVSEDARRCNSSSAPAPTRSISYEGYEP